MLDRQVLLYFAWSRPGEIDAPLTEIDDRFPAIFELRRLLYPDFERLADPSSVDQGIAGFLDHVQKRNFLTFADQAHAETGRPVRVVERVGDDGATAPLGGDLLAGVDTVVVISYDSLRTGQSASPAEVEAVARFLDDPDHLIFVCPHHDIGETPGGADPDTRLALQKSEHLHHGDKAIPPRQGFGGFARTLLAGLGVPVENRFGLRPAVGEDGLPAPFEADPALDDLALLHDVQAFNLHPHLPHFERLGPAVERMQVLARQRVDLTAPAHPDAGREMFDALLQSAPEVFAGRLLVCDATMFSSTAGGVENLSRLWTNVVQRPRR